MKHAALTFAVGSLCGLDLMEVVLDPWLDRGRSFGVGCGGVAGGVCESVAVGALEEREFEDE